MDRQFLQTVTEREFRSLSERETEEEIQFLSRPETKEEIDRIATQIVSRMLESGVIKP